MPGKRINVRFYNRWITKLIGWARAEQREVAMQTHVGPRPNLHALIWRYDTPTEFRSRFFYSVFL